MDEYSASQTTLEQIFNGFARLEGNNAKHRIFKMNPEEDNNFDNRPSSKNLNKTSPSSRVPSSALPQISNKTDKKLLNVDLQNEG